MDLYFMLRGNNTLKLITFPLKTFRQIVMSLKKEYYRIRPLNVIQQMIRQQE